MGREQDVEGHIGDSRGAGGGTQNAEAIRSQKREEKCGHTGGC